ncbi:hypothetical protein E2C01_055159 [Portunus trituberculatus]|uniref:Uncharacterized protein n=1 Tax=Portunus trituberculatus TaxID=210409 RepID=A0A5B7GU29_PORTR|nr:hypothetical protein [Portunus trituberculatus]
MIPLNSSHRLESVVGYNLQLPSLTSFIHAFSTPSALYADLYHSTSPWHPLTLPPQVRLRDSGGSRSRVQPGMLLRLPRELTYRRKRNRDLEGKQRSNARRLGRGTRDTGRGTEGVLASFAQLLPVSLPRVNYYD